MHTLAKTSALLVAVVGLGSFGAQGRAAAQAAPKITIDGYEYRGTGCPNGSVEAFDIVSNATSQTLPLKFLSYRVNVSPSQSFQTQNCQIVLYLKAPAGRRVALNTVTYYGRPSLDQGVTGRFEATYHWAGRQLAVRSAAPKVVTGPASTAFTWTDTTNANSWSDCAAEEELTIDTRLSLQNTSTPARGGELKIDKAEATVQGSVSLEFLVDATKCSGAR